MPTSLDVEKQNFAFGDQWTVVFKYDDTEFCQKEASKLQGIIDGVPQSAKAVDVVGLHAQRGMLLLEAKDFRGHRIANKTRVNEELATEVAVKVRDTVAALIGAGRQTVAEFPFQALFAAMGWGRDVAVVLWLEDDTFHDPARAKVTLGALTQKLKSKLTWLNVRPFALSSMVTNRLDHLTVTNLPKAGRSSSSASSRPPTK